MKTRPAPILCSLLLVLAGTVRAGSVISANLPAGTSIVNISGTQDGAAGNDPAGGLFSQPFAGDVSLTVSAGTYSFSLIDPADAAAAFPALTSGQLGSVNTGWTFNSPWTTDYIVFDLAATANSSRTQLFDGGDATYNAADTYGSAQAAYDAAKAGGYRNFIRPGSRDSLNFQTSYTFATATTLIFAVPDYALGDNAGGVSVVVQGVPEPSAAWWLALAGAGLAVSGWLRRHAA